MAFSASDLASVETAIKELASGERVTTVTIDGETTEYASVSLPALMALRDRINSDVNKALETARYKRVVHSKGY